MQWSMIRAALWTGSSMLLSCVAAGCAGEIIVEEEGSAGEAVGATEQALEESATFESSAGVTNDEKCRVPAARLNVDFDAGEQLMIKRGTDLRGLCTVDTVASAGANYQMSSTGLTNRVLNAGESSPVSGVTVSNQYQAGIAPAIAKPATSLNDARSNSADQVKEYMYRSPTAVTVLYAAPHPFEENTFEQAEHIHNQNTSRNAVWAVGIDNNSGLNDKFHIRSIDINEASFPKLDTLLSYKSRYSVAFHRQVSCTSDVVVGGLIESPFKQGVAEIISEYINNANIDVTWDEAGCDIGTSSSNFINRVTVDDRGLQLEQKGSVLDNSTHRTNLDDGVKSVFDCLIDSADDYVYTSSNSYVLTSSGTSYATNGACPRYIAEIEMTSTGARTLNAGSASCVAGYTAHVDYYRRNASSLWERVGGGLINYQSVGGMCTPVKVTSGPFPWVTPTVSAPNAFRAVVRASDSSGSPVQAYFRIDP